MGVCVCVFMRALSDAHAARRHSQTGINFHFTANSVAEKYTLYSYKYTIGVYRRKHGFYCFVCLTASAQTIVRCSIGRAVRRSEIARRSSLLPNYIFSLPFLYFVLMDFSWSGSLVTVLLIIIQCQFSISRWILASVSVCAAKILHILSERRFDLLLFE